MSTWRNYDEVVSTLISHDFMISGIDVGKMMRVKREGHTQKGWYIVHAITLDNGESALIGSFGYFFGGDSFTEKIAPGKGITLNKDQLAAISAQHKEAKKKAEAQRAFTADKAAKEASFAWSKYVVEGESSYLKRKGVKAYGLRFAPSGNGTVAIPMQDTGSKFWGLQIIRGKDRGNKLEKEYWPKGLDKKGHFHLIGSPKEVLLIAEGYATAATLHEATDLPVAVAFDAGNLLPVALALHKKYPRTKILVCADDDYLTEKETGSNPGVKAAENAALAVNGAWVKPIFEADREGKKLTDFNDLASYATGTVSTVTVQINDRIQQLGWGSQSTPVAVIASEGGGGAYKRRDAVSVMELGDAVARFVPLDDGTGDYVFDKWTRKIVKQKQMLAVLAAGIRGDDVKRHYEWQSRGAYYLDEIGFDPSEKDKKVKLNTWTGWEMTPKQGECTKILATLEHLCSKEKNADDVLWWIIKWMAYPLQNAGAKMGSAIILHGPQGTGKSLIFRILASIYGRYSTVIGNRGIEDKFNADWADSKLFILAEEVATSADKWNIKNELKELVTGETVRVNPKNVAAYSQKNQMNVAFLSNEDMPLPLEGDDRRHLVVYTPPCLAREHYNDALDERDNGGIEAFYHFLMNVDLTGFTRHTPPPKTESKNNLIEMSLPSDRRFIKHWTSGETKWIVCPCRTMDLYSAYREWCKENGEPWPRSSGIFLGMVKNQTGWVGLRKSEVGLDNKRTQFMVIVPPVEILQQSAYAKPEDKTESQWLSESCEYFKDSLDRNKS
jgi:putative DNA primase/helicase